MNPSSPFLILPAMMMVLLTTKVFLKFSSKRPPVVKYKTIDGLRGYLAFFVFLQHASIWYFYLHTGTWFEPPSRLYNHFGKTSVSVFFMITGFLFFSKLIESRKKPVDWLHLFVSRILRLYPVYLLAMVFLLIIVGALTQWKMNERPGFFLFELYQWSTFTIMGRPVINHSPYMENITAGVTWSLIYEWIFYLSLPVIGLIFFRSRVNIFLVFVSLMLVFIIYRYNLLRPIHFYSFAAGLIAAFCIRFKEFSLLAGRSVFSIVAMACLVSAVYFFQTPYEIFPLTLIAIAFVIISNGNNFFGLLSNPVSRMLGQISYPIYLLHPIALFITFKFILGFDRALQLSTFNYWLVIAVCAFALLAICFLVHYSIELPVMNLTTKVTSKIRNTCRFGGSRIRRLLARPVRTGIL